MIGIRESKVAILTFAYTHFEQQFAKARYEKCRAIVVANGTKAKKRVGQQQLQQLQQKLQQTETERKAAEAERKEAEARAQQAFEELLQEESGAQKGAAGGAAAAGGRQAAGAKKKNNKKKKKVAKPAAAAMAAAEPKDVGEWELFDSGHYILKTSVFQGNTKTFSCLSIAYFVYMKYILFV